MISLEKFKTKLADSGAFLVKYHPNTDGESSYIVCRLKPIKNTPSQPKYLFISIETGVTHIIHYTKKELYENFVVYEKYGLDELYKSINQTRLMEYCKEHGLI